MNRSQGVTMIELLVVISIVAIMAMIATPSLSGFVNQTRLNSIANMLVNDMRSAQSEAIKANRRVLVCAANNAHTDCASSTDWGVNGWLVCVEAGGVCDVAASAVAIRSPVQNNFTLTASSVSAVTYRPIGIVSNTQSISLSGGNGSVSGVVSVAATGSVTYKKN